VDPRFDVGDIRLGALVGGRPMCMEDTLVKKQLGHGRDAHTADLEIQGYAGIE